MSIHFSEGEANQNYALSLLDGQHLAKASVVKNVDLIRLQRGLEVLENKNEPINITQWNFKFLSEYPNQKEVAAVYKLALQIFLKNKEFLFEPGCALIWFGCHHISGQGGIELAKLISLKNSAFALEIANSWHVNDRATIMSIFQQAAQELGVDGSLLTSNQGNEMELVDLVKLFAKQKALRISTFIPFFHISNQASLIEIAKVAAQQPGCNTSEYIKNYGIEDQPTLIEIAKIAAQQPESCISKYLKNYGISDQAALIEIAKLEAQQPGNNISEYIKNYAINDQTALEEIAKCAAPHNRTISEYIKNYNIKDQATLIEIAKIAAQQDQTNISRFLKNYGIVDQDALVEIAMFSAQHNGPLTSDHIQIYDIKNEDALIKIAKLAAQQDITYHFHAAAYGIKNQKALAEIFKIADQHSGWKASKYIKYYCITDQALLVELAKYSVQHDGWFASRYIQDFGIKDPAALEEIAELCARHDGWSASENITYYGIKDPAFLVKIAKIAAQQDGFNTSRYIREYGIKDPAILKEIALIAAKQAGNMLRHLDQYFDKNQLDQQTFEKIVLMALGSGAQAGLDEIQDQFLTPNFLKLKSSVPSDQIDFQLIKEKLIALAHYIKLEKGPASPIEEKISTERSGAEEALCNKAIASAPTSSAKPEKSRLEMIIDIVLEEPRPFVRKQNMVWVLQSICKLTHFDTFSNTAEQPSIQEQIFDTLSRALAIHNPLLRKMLIDIAWQTLSDTATLTVFKQQRRAKKAPQFFFIQFFMAQLLQKHPSLEKTTIKEGKTILNLLYACNKDLKDKALYEPLYNLMQLWLATDDLTATDIAFMVQWIFANKDKERIIKRLKLLISLAQCATSKGLQQSQWQKYAGADENALNEYFTQLICQKVPVLPRDDFAILFMERFLAQRDGSALLRYSGGLQTLPSNDRQELLKALGVYIDNALKSPEEFSQWRLEQANSPHLQAVFLARPDLQQKWNIQKDYPLADYIGKDADTTENAFDLSTFLNKQLNTDQHIALPQLQKYLLESDALQKESIYRHLSMLVTTHTSEEERNKAQAQKLLIECTFKTFALQPTKAQLSHIEAISSALHLSDNHPFTADLNLIKQNIVRSQPQIDNSYRLLFTDNYYDLLMCGTDVEGSCQRVDGTPSLNKGLIGYLTHGQDRLLLIKNGAGKIQGRSILRLAWDQTKLKPVLFLSRLYPSNLAQNQQQAIIKLACELAQSLDLPLLSKEEGQGEAYKGTICGLGGAAPTEYIDEKPGLAEHGRYSVDHCHYLYKPQRVAVQSSPRS